MNNKEDKELTFLGANGWQIDYVQEKYYEYAQNVVKINNADDLINSEKDYSDVISKIIADRDRLERERKELEKYLNSLYPNYTGNKYQMTGSDIVTRNEEKNKPNKEAEQYQKLTQDLEKMNNAINYQQYVEELKEVNSKRQAMMEIFKDYAPNENKRKEFIELNNTISNLKSKIAFGVPYLNDLNSKQKEQIIESEEPEISIVTPEMVTEDKTNISDKILPEVFYEVLAPLNEKQNISVPIIPPVGDNNPIIPYDINEAAKIIAGNQDKDKKQGTYKKATPELIAKAAQWAKKHAKAILAAIIILGLLLVPKGCGKDEKPSPKDVVIPTNTIVQTDTTARVDPIDKIITPIINETPVTPTTPETPITPEVPVTPETPKVPIEPDKPSNDGVVAVLEGETFVADDTETAVVVDNSEGANSDKVPANGTNPEDSESVSNIETTTDENGTTINVTIDNQRDHVMTPEEIEAERLKNGITEEQVQEAIAAQEAAEAEQAANTAKTR